MCSVSRLRTGSVRGTKVRFAEILLAQSDLKFLNCKFEARHPVCLGSIQRILCITHTDEQKYI